MAESKIKVTDEIYFNDSASFIIKVVTENGKTFEDDFCCVGRKDYAKEIVKSLAKTLKEELESSEDVKSGWVKISVEENEQTTTISKQRLGRLYNGPVVPYYTLFYKEVNRGYLF
jgi:hypothetical protein